MFTLNTVRRVSQRINYGWWLPFKWSPFNGHLRPNKHFCKNVDQYTFARTTVCSIFSLWKICWKSDVCHGSHLFSKRLGPVQSLIWRSTMYCPQVMEDLLEEWCVSGGHPYDLDVTSLSVALEQARLKYHAQVRSTNEQFKVNLTELQM